MATKNCFACAATAEREGAKAAIGVLAAIEAGVATFESMRDGLCPLHRRMLEDYTVQVRRAFEGG
jgi:hypothetical protein